MQKMIEDIEHRFSLSLTLTPVNDIIEAALTALSEANQFTWALGEYEEVGCSQVASRLQPSLE